MKHQHEWAGQPMSPKPEAPRSVSDSMDSLAAVALRVRAERDALLAACLALVASIEPNGFDPTTEPHFREPIKAARAAIAKAEGAA